MVVSKGNPALKSKRIWWPNTLWVPVPVRSPRTTPVSRIRVNRSRYCRMQESKIKKAVRAARLQSGISRLRRIDAFTVAALFSHAGMLYNNCGQPTMAINDAWNRRSGPGGVPGASTKIRHRSRRPFWGRNRIDARGKDVFFARHGTTDINIVIVANDNYAEARLAA